MRMRYRTVAAGVLAALLAAYLAVEALGVPVVGDPRPSLDDPGPVSAAIAVGLLVADAIVPVAGSVVMLSLGALYGVPAAVALSLLGRGGQAAVGFALGRRARGAVHRHVRPEERTRADELLARHGALAIAATRPVPLLSESVIVLAGASPLGWGRGMLAALAGALPEAVVYSVAGAAAASFETAAAVWLSFLLVLALFWLAERRLTRAAPRPDRPAPR